MSNKYLLYLLLGHLLPQLVHVLQLLLSEALPPHVSEQGDAGGEDQAFLPACPLPQASKRYSLAGKLVQHPVQVLHLLLDVLARAQHGHRLPRPHKPIVGLGENQLFLFWLFVI